MMVQPEFLSKLRDFGLNSYESKLWTALLSRGISSAGELSDIANVPRSRSYDVLESLERKGFIIMKLGKPIKYIAVPPEEVLERVKKKISADAVKQMNILKELKDSELLGELTALHNQGADLVDPTELSGSLRGRNNTYNHLESLIKAAQKSVIIMTTSEGFLRKAEALKTALKAAARRGVKVRMAMPYHDAAASIAKECSSFTEIKHTQAQRSRFCIIDSMHVVFMLTDDKEANSSYDGAVWVNSPFFASTMEGFFDSEWKAMKATRAK